MFTRFSITLSSYDKTEDKFVELSPYVNKMKPLEFYHYCNKHFKVAEWKFCRFGIVDEKIFKIIDSNPPYQINVTITTKDDEVLATITKVFFSQPYSH